MPQEGASPDGDGAHGVGAIQRLGAVQRLCPHLVDAPDVVQDAVVNVLLAKVPASEKKLGRILVVVARPLS